MDEERSDRLRQDAELLTALSSTSSILTVDPVGNPPERYMLVFRGRGLARGQTGQTDVVCVEEHRCELRMPYSYPERPPDVRWQTSLFHPNVSFSGFIHLRDLGIPWSRDVTLDVLVERLWDVARGAFFNLEKATNFAARNWFESQADWKLPVDSRPLRDKLIRTSKNRNVVKYDRRDRPRREPTRDLFYIDENTPVPDLPRKLPLRRVLDDDDDVLYIGD